MRPLYQAKHGSGHLCEGIVKHSSLSLNHLAIVTGRFTRITEWLVTETTGAKNIENDSIHVQKF